MSRYYFPKDEETDVLLMRLKDGQASLHAHKKHIAIIFEPNNKSYHSILRIYTRTGELVKQWKSISFGRANALYKDFIASAADSPALPVAKVRFLCENGERFGSFSDESVSLYEFFPTLQRYDALGKSIPNVGRRMWQAHRYNR